MSRPNDVSQWLHSFKTTNADSTQGSRKFKGQKAVVISVTGGKGGVGKTTIALKMSMTLAAQGHRTLLIDCDTNLSNTAIKLGLPLSDTFLSLLTAEKTLEECLYQDGCFHLLTGCNGNLEIFENRINLEQIIIDIISSHEQDYDYIVLDCPAGLQRETLTLNAYSDHRVVVVTPDKSSITDSYSLIKILKQKYGVLDNHLLINRYDHEHQYQRVVKTLSETIENFLECRTHVLGGIPDVDCQIDRFDSAVIQDEHSDLNKLFTKVVSKLTDRSPSRLSEDRMIRQWREERGQDVHV